MIHIKNEKIERLMLAVPAGHTHIRAHLKISGDEILINEATLAALVRGYIDIKTHPEKTGVEFKALLSGERKRGFAPMQLIETERRGEEVAREVSEILHKLPKGKKDDATF